MSMADGSSEVELHPKPARLVSLDFLRGLVLTMVLVDHVDDLIPDYDFFTRWTLKGLGFSDAAEAFVFLAGFTFGWVYTPRLERDGFWTCQRRVLLRAVKIYLAMIVTTVVTATLAWSISRSSLAFRLPLTVTTPTMFLDAVRDTATFVDPVWGVAILVVYVCVLPFLPATLLLARRSPFAALGLSGAVYAGSQLLPAMAAGDAGFNPLAWQVLIVTGVVAGQAAVSRGAIRFKPVLIAAAGLILAVGLLATLGIDVLPLSSHADWIKQSMLHSSVFSKTNLGIGRIMHFAAVALVAAAVVQRWPALALARWAQPFAWSGRHSLLLFCVGVVLAYLSAIASAFLPSHLGTLLFLAADAALIQFTVAWLLEQRRLRRHAVLQIR
jgi:hypothetical protein